MSFASTNYRNEVFDSTFYKELASIEKDRKLREVLLKLSEMESKHAEFWATVSTRRRERLSKLRYSDKLKIKAYKILRRILGLQLTIRLLEAGEESAISRYYFLLNSPELTEEERKRLSEILVDELVHEEVFKGFEAKSIGDFVYGISDGLVEVLAAVSGFSGAFVSPLIVALSGLIVGASGTLSMSIGAYLSTKSEKEVKEIERRKLIAEKKVSKKAIEERLTDFLNNLGVRKSVAEKAAPDMIDNAEDVLYPEENVSPGKSALITGISYLIGAVIPVLPYLGGFSGLVGVIASYIIAGISTFIVGSIIGILSGVNPLKKGLTMTALALLAAIATHLIGYSVSIIVK